MEDFQLDLIIGEGPAARSVKIDLAKFTLVGATTRTGLLTTPLRDRFGIPIRLDFYNEAGGIARNRQARCPHLANAGDRRWGAGNRKAFTRHAAHCRKVAAAGAGFCIGRRAMWRLMCKSADRALAGRWMWIMRGWMGWTIATSNASP